MHSAPEIVEVEQTQLDEVLRRVEQALDEKDAKLIRAVFQSYAYVTELVEDQNTSIRRLRQLFFGKRTEKTQRVIERSAQMRTGTAAPSAEENAVTVAASESGASAEAGRQAGPAGHGRHGAEAYRGGERLDVLHPSLKAGEPCPARGKMGARSMLCTFI